MALSSILLLSTQLMLLETPTLPAFPLNLQGDAVIAAVGRWRPQQKIFHPPTNSCILRKRLEDPLKLAPCEESDSWKYSPQKFLTVSGTYYCLQAAGPSLPAKLSIVCTVSDSQWTQQSEPKHLSTQLEDGAVLCLDVDDDDNTIITNPCRNSTSDAIAAQDDSQWFEITTFS